MKKKEQKALFRHGVLGSLISRNKIEHGELKKLIQQAADRDYDIPGSVHTRIAEKTIEGWYYKYLREQLDGLRPKVRKDRGMSKLPLDIDSGHSPLTLSGGLKSVQTACGLFVKTRSYAVFRFRQLI